MHTSGINKAQDNGVIIKQMSDDDRIREQARMREKALHDHATAMSYARQQGEANKGARVAALMRAKGFDEATIVEIANA